MFSLGHILAGIVVLIELFYWFVYIPRAWSRRSNAELETIRSAAKGLAAFYREGGY